MAQQPKTDSGVPPVRPLDLLVSVCLLALMLGEIYVNDIPGERWLLIVSAVVQSMALLWRRSRPRVVALAVISANTLPNFFGTPSNESTTFGLIAIVLAMYSLGHYGLSRPEDRPRTAATIALALAIAFSSTIYQSGLRAGDFVFISIFAIAPVAFGRAIAASQRGRTEAELATIELAEVSSKLREIAVRDERERIARELHDVIAHSVSVMGLQAGAARKVLPPGNDAVATNLRSIEAIGRDTLGELRRMLGVMRDHGDSGELTPQPGLADLPELADKLRASGIRIELTLGDGLTRLSPGVDLAAFRIVQEALTNSVKHAPNSPVAVTVGTSNGRIELAIVSAEAVPGSGDGDGDGDGHGITGMRERAMIYGGLLKAGFDMEEGFAVRAELPAEYLSETEAIAPVVDT